MTTGLIAWSSGVGSVDLIGLVEEAFTTLREGDPVEQAQIGCQMPIGTNAS